MNKTSNLMMIKISSDSVSHTNKIPYTVNIEY